MSTRRTTITVLLAASAFVPAGCGADDEQTTRKSTPPTEPTTAASPEGASVPETLKGTYAITVKAKDTSDKGGASAGRWILTISDEATFLDGPGGRHIPLDPTELTETQMVVPADPGCPNNRPAPGEGTYEVHVSGKHLRFTKLKDPCGDRGFTLSHYRWRRIGNS